MSTVEQPEEPAGWFYPCEEALQRARPLVSIELVVVGDGPDYQWTAFQHAMAEP